MGIAVAVAAAGCLFFLILLVASIGHLTGERRRIAARYVVLGFVTVWVLTDWLSGATGWVMMEGVLLVVAIPFAVAHLTILLKQESRN